jgi:CBS domain-containing protein
MNILFFLIPKKDVEYIEDTFTIRQALEKMDFHKYTAIPVIDKDGKYVETISDGDILRYLKSKMLNWNETMIESVSVIKVMREIRPITIDKDISDLVELIINQNFVPVVDDNNHFIGIITRRAVINYLTKHANS